MKTGVVVYLLRYVLLAILVVLIAAGCNRPSQQEAASNQNKVPPETIIRGVWSLRFKGPIAPDYAANTLVSLEASDGRLTGSALTSLQQKELRGVIHGSFNDDEVAFYIIYPRHAVGPLQSLLRLKIGRMYGYASSHPDYGGGAWTAEKLAK